MKIVLDLDGGAKYYSLPESIYQELKKNFPEHEISKVTECQDFYDADMWACWTIHPDTFTKLKNLKTVIYAVDGMGKHRLYPEIINSPVTVCNSRGCRSQAIAEHAFALLLACAKRLNLQSKTMDKDGWWGLGAINRGKKPIMLEGATIGILGLGEIGSRIAGIAKNGFEMKVLGLRRNPKPTENVDLVFGTENLPELLSKSDFIIVALPDTDETSHLLDEQMIGHIKDGAILVNISRGNIISSQSLITAIKSGKISAAGLDVFETEPLPEDSLLRNMEEIVLTPHAAGSGADFWPCFARIISINIERLTTGHPLINVVDKKLGY